MSSKNCMKEIAEMLGIELNTRFYIIDKDKKKYECILTDDGLKRCYTDGSILLNHAMFVGLVSGNFKIRKMAYKPKMGQKYYVPYIENGEVDINSRVYLDSAGDKLRYKAGMICKTPKEAREKAKKLLAVLGGEE